MIEPTSNPRWLRLAAVLLAVGLTTALVGCKSSSDESSTEPPATAPTEPADEPDAAPEPTDAPRDGDPLPQVSAEVTELVQGRRELALELYRQVADTQDGNLFLSPASLSTALTMPFLGATGETAREMRTTLRLPGGDAKAVATSAGELRQVMAGAEREGVALHIANRLFVSTDVELVDGFADTVETHFGAGIDPVDFGGNVDGAIEHINNWIAEQTEGHIPDLLSPDSVDGETRLVLTNAVYFKGDWASQFPVEATDNGEFQTADRGPVEVPMMRQTGTFRMAELDDLQLVELPFRGKRLSMLVVVPPEDGLPDLERTLERDVLDGWLETLASTEVEVVLPRFELSTGIELADTLRALGMERPFDDSAELDAMIEGGDVKLDKVVHKTFVAVDEQGTEAAAATGVTVKVTSARVIPTIAADRPFLFLIQDAATRDILFIGRVLDPTATSDERRE